MQKMSTPSSVLIRESSNIWSFNLQYLPSQLYSPVYIWMFYFLASNIFVLTNLNSVLSGFSPVWTLSWKGCSQFVKWPRPHLTGVPLSNPQTVNLSLNCEVFSRFYWLFSDLGAKLSKQSKYLSTWGQLCISDLIPGFFGCQGLPLISLLSVYWPEW